VNAHSFWGDVPSVGALKNGWCSAVVGVQRLGGEPAGGTLSGLYASFRIIDPHRTGKPGFLPESVGSSQYPLNFCAALTCLAPFVNGLPCNSNA
jgi:hypothetical protein